MVSIMAKWTVMIFGLFLILVGIMMLVDPERARRTLRKAGSTNLINYGEITIRMIPALALVYSAHLSKYPDFFKIFGSFMLITSLILYLVPKRVHHNYAMRSADILIPNLVRLLSPLSMLFGAILIDAVA